jgi:hypothetical protein
VLVVSVLVQTIAALRARQRHDVGDGADFVVVERSGKLERKRRLEANL